MSLCVLCGKEYARDVTNAHLKSHGLNRDDYNDSEDALSESVWNFYWSHAGLRAKFPDPLASKGEDGKLTFIEWCNLPKVQSKYEELRA